MRLSEAIELLARRLHGKRGRIAAIANRLQHASMLPLADAKRTPPEINEYELAALMLAVLAERGIGDAATRAGEYAAMTGEGCRLHETIAAVLRGQVQPGDVIVREGGAHSTIGSQHVVFGNPTEDGAARFVTGPTLAAIASEFQGAPLHLADAVAAIQRIT